MAVARATSLCASLLLVAGCGRLGFDGGPGNDGVTIDAGPSDANADSLVDGLQIWFEFGAGAPTLDSARQRLATCSSCPDTAPGPRGDAAVFDGSDCLILADASEYEASEFTLALWVRNDGGGSGNAFSKPYLGALGFRNSWELWMESDMSLQFNTLVGPTPASRDVEGLTLGQWTHLAGTFTPSAQRLYVDGVLVSEGDPADGVMAFEDDPVRVGCDLDNNAETQHVIGALDDVRYYDRAITVAEVALLAAP